ncbi:MAG: hypothetical protein ACRBF0_00030 [Calditrichia bacterium]
MNASRYFVIVQLWIKSDHTAAFEAFEKKAAAAMADFGGRIDNVIRHAEQDDKNPFETHLLSFVNETSFNDYLSSAAARNLADERKRVVEKSLIFPGRQLDYLRDDS